MPKILYACSELHPLVKTGGLADVAGCLPIALKNLRQDIRVVMPAYREAMTRAGELKPVASFPVADIGGTTQTITVLEGYLPQSRVKLYLIDAPVYFDRPGGPYADPAGQDWPDNAARFGLFCRAVMTLALNQAGLAWQPDIIHCNDWQTALVPPLLAASAARPATVFTIHNLAYQGLYPQPVFESLNLAPALWSSEALEFFGQLSFIKGGLVFADLLNTVSPTYAGEIRTPAFGYGLEGLLNHRAAQLTGILNGVDYTVWDPRHDPHITKNFNSLTLNLKGMNKADLQHYFKLPVDRDIPLIGFVGRMVEQKGVDLLIEIMPELLKHRVQVVMLGTGETRFEAALLALAALYPDQFGLHIGYEEALAHRVEAGADIFLMPSRFEPCGLNQIYSLRYGTIPVVRRTGGLADTIVDTTRESVRNGTATGFVFDGATADALLAVMLRATVYFANIRNWRILMKQAMRQDFSWQTSARHYLALYQQAMKSRAARMTQAASNPLY